MKPQPGKLVNKTEARQDKPAASAISMEQTSKPISSTTARPRHRPISLDTIIRDRFDRQAAICEIILADLPQASVERLKPHLAGADLPTLGRELLATNTGLGKCLLYHQPARLSNTDLATRMNKIILLEL